MANKRYITAATWVVQLLRGHQFALEHTIHLQPVRINRHDRRVEFDASPWGGGFVLIEKGEVIEWGVVEWHDNYAPHLGVVPNLPKWQSFWELAMLLP